MESALTRGIKVNGAVHMRWYVDAIGRRLNRVNIQGRKIKVAAKRQHVGRANTSPELLQRHLGDSSDSVLCWRS